MNFTTIFDRFTLIIKFLYLGKWDNQVQSFKTIKIPVPVSEGLFLTRD
ncbi:hypothetical protein [Echinicola pacifica]|nr:hypothetical protein [Echinicola pacifica]